jgi:hypothetical protein
MRFNSIFFIISASTGTFPFQRYRSTCLILPIIFTVTCYVISNIQKYHIFPVFTNAMTYSYKYVKDQHAEFVDKYLRHIRIKFLILKKGIIQEFREKIYSEVKETRQ